MNGHFFRALMRRHIFVFDPVLLFALATVVTFSCVTMYSASYETPDRLVDHLRNLAISFAVMWAVTNLSPTTMMRSAIPLYLLGVTLLVGVALFGEVSKGARPAPPARPAGRWRSGSGAT